MKQEVKCASALIPFHCIRWLEMALVYLVQYSHIKWAEMKLREWAVFQPELGLRSFSCLSSALSSILFCHDFHSHML